MWIERIDGRRQSEYVVSLWEKNMVHQSWTTGALMILIGVVGGCRTSNAIIPPWDWPIPGERMLVIDDGVKLPEQNISWCVGETSNTVISDGFVASDVCWRGEQQCSQALSFDWVILQDDVEPQQFGYSVSRIVDVTALSCEDDAQAVQVSWHEPYTSLTVLHERMDPQSSVTLVTYLDAVGRLWEFGTMVDGGWPLQIDGEKLTLHDIDE